MVDSVVAGTFFVVLSSPAKMLEMSPGEWWQWPGLPGFQNDYGPKSTKTFVGPTRVWVEFDHEV
jgi:hypothetical protein